MSTLIGNGSITFGDGSVQSSAAGGYGQSWQDVKASRAFNQGYINSTGKPIMVNIQGGQAAYGTVWSIIVNGGAGNVVTSASYTNPNDSSATISSIIPPGHTYYVTGGGTINYWAELR